jgi:single-strand DNA-binding protein
LKSPSGKKVAHFSLGVTQRWKSAGETKENTEWVNVEAWDRLGEVAQEYLKKGSLVYIEGRLKTDRYEDKGETRYFTKVVAQMVQFLDARTGEPMTEQPAVLEEDLESSEFPF